MYGACKNSVAKPEQGWPIGLGIEDASLFLFNKLVPSSVSAEPQGKESIVEVELFLVCL